MKKVSIHDVAKRARVSIATVSRVINNNYYVKPDIVARVKRAVKETDYYPDTIARGMRSRKSYAIGYVVSDISNSYFTVAAKAVEEALGNEGYSLIVCSTGDDINKEANQLRLLMSKKVDGLIINSSGLNDSMVASLSHQVPVVLLSRKIGLPSFAGDFVGCDEFRGTYELGRYVLAMGHRRIGLIRGPDTFSTGVERFNGFMTALREGDVNLPKSMIYYGDHRQQSGLDGARALLGTAKPPTILVAMNNAMALGALTYIKQCGLSIPEDVSFAAHGDIINRELFYVSPTTISQNSSQEGKLAGELLMRRIVDNGATPVIVSVPSHLLEGCSIRKIE